MEAELRKYLHETTEIKRSPAGTFKTVTRITGQSGWHHEEGKGVPRNLAEAVKWYRAAAEQNDPRAAGNLGNMYQLGRGVAKDCKAAVEWLRGALSTRIRGASTAWAGCITSASA